VHNCSVNQDETGISFTSCVSMWTEYGVDLTGLEYSPASISYVRKNGRLKPITFLGFSWQMYD
jgi:hypothetical protein